MEPLQIFCIFHKQIFDECYEHLTDEELQYFTFVAVNKSIPKEYSTKRNYKFIKEWELPIYNKEYQAIGLNENSVIFHVYQNNLHRNYNRIGFCQYDMIWPKGEVTRILNNSTYNFGLFPVSFNDAIYNTWNEPNTYNIIENEYSKYFNNIINKDKPVLLLNTYIIDSNNYNYIMDFAIQLHKIIYPSCIRPPNATHFGHYGGIYERIMGILIGQTITNCILLNINHDHNIKKMSY